MSEGDGRCTTVLKRLGPWTTSHGFSSLGVRSLSSEKHLMVCSCACACACACRRTMCLGESPSCPARIIVAVAVAVAVVQLDCMIGDSRWLELADTGRH